MSNFRNKGTAPLRGASVAKTRLEPFGSVPHVGTVVHAANYAPLYGGVTVTMTDIWIYAKGIYPIKIAIVVLNKNDTN